MVARPLLVGCVATIGCFALAAQAEPGHRPSATRAPTTRRPASGDANYHQAMTGLHAAGGHQPVDAAGRPMLVLRNLGRNERVELSAATERGGFSAYDLDRAAHALRASGGEEHPVDPRTLNIVYRIQTHFGAPEIRIVSGYRVPTGKSSHSNHGKGRAIDFVLAGVPDQEVAKLAREFGFVGVGIYPTSQFVHVDIRPQSYFWIDYSGPGKRNRERGILRDLAIWGDQQALRRGEKPIEPFGIVSDVDAARRARTQAAGASDEDDEDGD